MTFPTSSSSSDFSARVAENLSHVQSRIVATGRALADVTIVAVTKTFPTEAVIAAAQCGLCVMGENYLEELTPKRHELPTLAVTWQYLGHLQTNKIARIAQVADVVTSLAREKEVTFFARQERQPTFYVQVDFTNAEARNGAAPSEVPRLVDFAREAGLSVTGLMTVAPPEVEGARRAFAGTAALADSLELPVRSMGMSDDLELALAAGTTEIRLGRALFGARNP